MPPVGTATVGGEGSPTSSPAGAPTLVEPECHDTGACAAGFVVGDTFYALSCGPVRPDVVSEETLARGGLYGEEVEVRSVTGVSSDLLVAVSIEGGDCADGDVPLSPWSMAFPEGGSQSELKAAICAVVVDGHRARNNCD